MNDKPLRLVAVATACNAQTRLVEAIECLSAYESQDLDGALVQLRLAVGLAEEARMAVRRAIIDRDCGKLDFAAGTRNLGDLVEVDDKGAQREMAAIHHARTDKLEAERAEAGITALLDDTAAVTNSDRDNRRQDVA